MKTTHIILLVAIAVVIGLLISTMGNLSTYDTVSSARAKNGKFVHLIARLDTAQGRVIQYDPLRDPNYLSFHVSSRFVIICNNNYVIKVFLKQFYLCV